MLHGPSGRYAGGATGPVKFSEAEYADASYLDQFKFKAREWWSQVNKLRTMSVPANLESERKRLIGLADSVKDAIVKVTSLSDSLKIPGLAAAPLIPIAAVAAALAAITWWTSMFTTFMEKYQAAKYQAQLVEQGVPPTEAARIAQQQVEAARASQGPLALLLDNWQWIAVGLAGLFLYRMVKK